jgi:hypothetical protein
MVRLSVLNAFFASGLRGKFMLLLLNKLRRERISVCISPADATLHFLIDIDILFARLIEPEKILDEHTAIFRRTVPIFFAVIRTVG